MHPATPLHALARQLGIETEYTDGLHRRQRVGDETLWRVAAALGAPLDHPDQADGALRAVLAERRAHPLPPVLVAWEGRLAPVEAGEEIEWAELRLEQGDQGGIRVEGPRLSTPMLPFGYHRLEVAMGGVRHRATVISAPAESFRRPGLGRSWGVGAQLPALRSRRSRSIGDLRDLHRTCDWVARHGGDLVTLLPLLPTFNEQDPEPSPYSAVSRLFWSELYLDLGAAHRAVPPPDRLDITTATREVRAALAGHPAPEAAQIDEELRRYAQFRGAQHRLGRNWQAWPALAREGHLDPGDVDSDTERFHLIAQVMMRQQLGAVVADLESRGLRLGLDLAVGVHPDSYDAWSRRHLFRHDVSVGAPPDLGFPSGQDWGFPPMLPEASRAEGHRYLAAAIRLQAERAGVLRVDHIMAFTRLYWIPHGLGLHEGTYVRYPAEELFAVLTLESHRHQCEIVGENLGTVPMEVAEALPRHRIRGMYLAEYHATDPGHVAPPDARSMAMIGTHDTPTFAGWLTGDDINDRLKFGLLDAEHEPAVRAERSAAIGRLASLLDGDADDPADLLARLLAWLGRSESDLVVPWIEDLWLEPRGVNLPGTRSSERPNWQRPMARLLEELEADPEIRRRMDRLEAARRGADSP